MFSETAVIPIKRGPNFKHILVALLLVALGIAAAVATALGLVSLSIGRLELPSWSNYVLATLSALLGFALFAFSIDAERCGGCGKHLVHGEAYFPLEWERHVLRAVELGVPYALAGAPMVPKNQMKMAVEMSYCPGCGGAGKMSVTKWEDFQPHTLIEERAISGEGAVGFAKVVCAHREWRGDDE